jgi:hypothetical protein
MREYMADFFCIRAEFFCGFGLFGLLGLEMPFGPFFERRNGKVAACSPAIKSQFKIYMFDHIAHIQCTTTVEAITINHDEIEDKSFIMQQRTNFVFLTF